MRVCTGPCMAVLCLLMLWRCSGENGGKDLSISETVDGVLDVDAHADVLADAAKETNSDKGPELPFVPDVVELVPDVPLGPCEGSSCPEGFCDEATGTCLYCDEEVVCSKPGTWCRDNWCVTTLCIPGSVDCAGLTEARECAENGEAFISTQCEEGYGCHLGQCLPIICEAGKRECGAAGMLKVCAPNGVAWIPTGCPPGQSCTMGECRPLQHNLLVIFDTSSSMAQDPFGMGGVPCICTACENKPFPMCEDPLCPKSKLGMSKHVFNKFFSSTNIGSVNLVLTHFPMRIKYPATTACNNMFAMARGYYGMGMGDSDFMTGDDASHETADGGWFDKYLYEILSVPFPVDSQEDNLGKAKLWVDFDEQVGPTETECAVMADCPGGFCADNEGKKVCWYHTNGELRALSNTPLGRSMFYAGEIYRKMIMVDGKQCVTSADCKNENYYCTVDGKCKDPYADCRVNMILMFTDGEESPETSTSEFFNPRVQAKRFRYGLRCDSNDDCFEGSVCVADMCRDYPHPNGGSASFPGNLEEPRRLFRYDGKPIRIMTHVIDMSASGSTNNRGIADDGGGSYYQATAADPDAMLGQLLSLVDVKQNMLGCVPDYEGIVQ